MEENKKIIFKIIVIAVLISSIFGVMAGFWGGLAGRQFNNLFFQKKEKNSDNENDKIIKINEESAVISAVEKVSPAVVSIIITKDLPKIEQYYSQPFGSDFFRQFFGDDFNNFFNEPQYRQNGTEKKEVGGGTGFIISADGYIVTNKHVASDEQAEYTVLMNDGVSLPAKVLARDPLNDLAVLKIDAKKKVPFAELGDSANLKVGQSVIAIGNALGEFRNTVSTGVISGLARSITAGGAGVETEQLIGVIQTDASINPGNSGGPLLNIAGQVIGINTAIAQGAQNIGFAIPINEIKNSIENVKKTGKINRPYLGVRYAIINKAIAGANKLEVDYGALIIRGEQRTDLAVIPGSPADKAGLEENDIILEINNKKITEEYPLAAAISKQKAGDEIVLKILHKGKKKDIKIRLEEMK
jgi:S1-C subfamily serine protease